MNKSDNEFGWFQVFKTAMTYTQLGLSVVMPLILCVLLAYWLQRKFSLDNCVTLVGLAIGLAAMIFTLARYICGYIRESKKRQDELKDKNADREE